MTQQIEKNEMNIIDLPMTPEGKYDIEKIKELF